MTTEAIVANVDRRVVETGMVGAIISLAESAGLAVVGLSRRAGVDGGLAVALEGEDARRKWATAIERMDGSTTLVSLRIEGEVVVAAYRDFVERHAVDGDGERTIRSASWKALPGMAS